MDAGFIEVISQAQIEKLAEVASRIWHEYFPAILSDAQIDYMVEKFQSAPAIARQLAQGGYRYFFLTAQGEILGYLGVKSEQDRLFLSKLYLKKEFRGQGYFSQMLSFAEKLAGEQGLKRQYLTVNKYNDHAIAVYLKKGFRVLCEQKTDIGNGFAMDDYVMEKML